MKHTSLSEYLIERLIRVTGILVILFLALIFLFLLHQPAAGAADGGIHRRGSPSLGA
jgi:hypothetical protein